MLSPFRKWLLGLGHLVPWGRVGVPPPAKWVQDSVVKGQQIRLGEFN